MTLFSLILIGPLSTVDSRIHYRPISRDTPRRNRPSGSCSKPLASRILLQKTRAMSAAKEGGPGEPAAESYFERLHREAAGVREAARPFTDSFMGKLKLLDLSEGAHDSCEDVAACPQISICYLHTNALTALEHVDRCRMLRKLDVHANQLQQLPGELFWSQLVHLQVLHLHTNNITRLEDVQGLAALPRLTILSLYRNPIALHPLYRSRIIRQMVSTLRVLDHFAVSLEEAMDGEARQRGYRFGEVFGAFSKNLRFKSSSALTTRFVEHVDALNNEVAAAKALSLRYNPAAMVQRCWRGFRTRARLHRMRAARRMQTMTRGFLVRRRKALGLDPNVARATRMPAAFLKDVVWSVYFTPDMAPVMQDLASRAMSKARGGARPRSAGEDTAAVAANIQWSDFLVLRPLDAAVPWAHTDDVTGVETSTKWAAGGLLRRCRTSLSQVVGTVQRALWVRCCPSVRGDYPHADPRGSRLLGHKPVGLLASRHEHADLAASFRKAVSATFASTVDTEQQSLLRGAPEGERLLCWTAPNAVALTTLLDMVDLVNAGKGSKFWPQLQGDHAADGHRVRLVSDYTVRRLAAATSIQASWRAHRDRVGMPTPMHVLLRQARGRVCIQRWWRWRLLRRRMAFLRDLHDIVSNIDSAEVYLPETYCTGMDDVRFQPMTLFPEQKRKVSLVQGERVMILPDMSASRQGYPRWTAAGCVPVGANQSLRDGDDTGQQVALTNSQIAYSTATMDPVCPAVRDMVFLSHHNFVRFVYPSVAAARARAAVLLVRTWKSVMGGSSALRLMSKTTLQRNGAASCIQSCFRGSRIRASYLHHRRAASRMSQTFDDMVSAATHTVDGFAADQRHLTLAKARSSPSCEELELYGEAPVSIWGSTEYQGGTGGIAFRPDELNRLAQDLRDETRRAALEQNEMELTELAHLQMNARRQRQQQAEARSSQALAKAAAGISMAAEQYSDYARQMRAEDAVDKRAQVDRIKTDRAAAREQLRREQLAAEAVKAGKRVAEKQELAARKEANDIAEVRAVASVRRRMRVTLNTQRGLGGDHLFAANFVRQNNAIGRQMSMSE
eukprot:COSAG01_NODE_5268_length_4372_cov_60.286918_2_plen_1071_part_01